MEDFVTTSFELTNTLIAVRYKAALAAKCLEWLNRNKYTDQRIRENYTGNRMLESQLDLFDKAKTRVENVLKNCDR